MLAGARLATILQNTCKQQPEPGFGPLFTMSFELAFALVVFAFVFSVTPGPNNLMLLASGTNYGFRATVPYLLGVNIGFMVMVLLVGLGIMQVIEAYPMVHTALKVLCVAYLLYLSWRIAMASPPSNQADQGDRVARPLTFIEAALFQWVNPKAWAFALAAISIYAPPLEPLQSVVFVVLISGITNLPSILVWVAMGTYLRKVLSSARRLRTFNWVAAGLLVCCVYPVLFDSRF